MRILFAAVLVVFSLGCVAQQFSLGIKGGTNLQKLTFDDFEGQQVYDDVRSGKRELGYHAGAWGRAILGPVVIQSELLFTHMVTTAKASGGTPSETQSLDIAFNRFDMPLLLGAKLGPFMLGAGAVGSYNFEGKEDIFNKSINEFTWGYQAVAGVIIKKVTIDFRYEGAFGSTAHQIMINGTPYTTDIRTNQLIIGLAIDML